MLRSRAATVAYLWLVVAARNLLQRAWDALRHRELSVSYWQDVARRMTDMVKHRQDTIETLRQQRRRDNESFFHYDMWAENGLGPGALPPATRGD